MKAEIHHHTVHCWVKGCGRHAHKNRDTEKNTGHMETLGVGADKDEVEGGGVVIQKQWCDLFQV